MKIRDIDALANERNTEIHDLDCKIAEAEKKKELCNQQITEAAEAGDGDAYRKASSALADLETDIFCLNTRQNKLKREPAISTDMIEAGWKEYVKEHNGILKKMTEKFEKSKTAMLKDYGDLLSVQEDLVNTYERLRSYNKEAKLIPAEMITCLGGLYSGPGLLSMNGTSLKDPDVVYYLSNYARSHNIPNSVEFIDNAENKRVFRIFKKM